MSQLSEEPARWLIVGLGNPEKKYAANRHNVGFHVLDRLAVKSGVSITDRRFQGWFGKAALGPHTM
ncbi:MAG: aminoacyl-tRNA hydrolase, partial [Chloroflexi bacterium]|nr:aminoacyl-tRNA hydrolase [Chloroflexota bacterium]